MNATPATIRDCFDSAFNFPSSPVMGQVATTATDGPDIRTMRMFAVDDIGRPIFLSHTATGKWEQLASNRQIAICFLNARNDTQITLRGHVELITTSDNDELLTPFWKMLRRDVKKIYNNHAVEGPYTPGDALSPPEDPPPLFGMIRVVPDTWELLDLTAGEYPQCIRTIYQRNNDDWTATRLNVG